MPFALKFDAVDLPGLWDVAGWDEAEESRIVAHRFPRRDAGVIDQLPAFGPRTVTLRGEIYGNTEAALKDASNTLRSTFNRVGSGKLQKYGVSSPTRPDDQAYLNVVKARLRTTIDATRIPSRRLIAEAEFNASDPYWYASVETTNTQAGITTAGPSVYSWTITPGGTAMTPFVMSIARTAPTVNYTSVRIDNTDEILTLYFNAQLNNSEVLTFDTLNGLCLVGPTAGSGANRLDVFGAGQIYQMLLPTINHLAYVGPTTVTITTKFRARWY